MLLAWNFAIDSINLLRRRFLPMVTWIVAGLAGQLVFTKLALKISTFRVHEIDGVYRGPAVLSLASTCVFAMSIVSLLVGIMGALFVVRDELPYVTALLERRLDRVDDPHETSDRVLESIAASLLPFLVFYGAWGLFRQDWRNFQVHIVLSGGSPAYAARESVYLGAAAVVLVLRIVAERFWERGRVLAMGVAAGVLEGLWMVLALIGLSGYIARAKHWLALRRIVHGADGWWHAFLDKLTPDAADIVSRVPAHISLHLLLPMVWLVIGITMFEGRLDKRLEEAERGRDLSHLPPQYGRLRRMLVRITGELQEKYVPMFVAARHVVRAGVVAFLAYALVYECATLLVDVVDAGVRLAIGPRSNNFWNAVGELWTMFDDVVTEPVRIAVIAVGVDELLRRSAGLRARHDAARATAERVASRAPAITA